MAQWDPSPASLLSVPRPALRSSPAHALRATASRNCPVPDCGARLTSQQLDAHLQDDHQALKQAEFDIINDYIRANGQFGQLQPYHCPCTKSFASMRLADRVKEHLWGLSPERGEVAEHKSMAQYLKTERLKYHAFVNIGSTKPLSFEEIEIILSEVDKTSMEKQQRGSLGPRFACLCGEVVSAIRGAISIHLHMIRDPVKITEHRHEARYILHRDTPDQAVNTPIATAAAPSWSLEELSIQDLTSVPNSGPEFDSFQGFFDSGNGPNGGLINNAMVGPSNVVPSGSRFNIQENSTLKQDLTTSRFLPYGSVPDGAGYNESPYDTSRQQNYAEHGASQSALAQTEFVQYGLTQNAIPPNEIAQSELEHYRFVPSDGA